MFRLTALVGLLLFVLSCSSNPTSSNASGKAIDINAIGGLLKGRWINIDVSYDDYWLRDKTEVWVLVIADAEGKPDIFAYSLYLVYDTLDNRRLTPSEIGIEDQVIEGNIVWEKDESGFIRPIEDNGKGHILFDRYWPVEHSTMGFRIETGNRIVVWNNALKTLSWWGNALLRSKLWFNCNANPDYFLCSSQSWPP